MRNAIINSLIGALGLMAAAGGVHATTVGGPPDCPATPNFSGQMHVITSSVTDNGGGVYTYDYRVCNLTGGELSQQLVDFELPWFDSYGSTVGAGNPIVSILTPSDWAWEIETESTPTQDNHDANSNWAGNIVWNDSGDPQKAHFDALFGGAANNPFNAHTRVLHFHTGTNEVQPNPIGPGGQLSGFSIVSTFGPSPVGAPDQSSWASIPPRTGDPDLPLGPNPSSTEIQQAHNSSNSIPEPRIFVLLSVGLTALLGLGKLRGSPWAG